MTRSDRNQSRNHRKQLLNLQLSILPRFTSANDYRVYLINSKTSPWLLRDLITMASTTTKYTVDTEQDCYTLEPALIQIEIIGAQSTVLLIETCHLPDASMPVFSLMQTLLRVIFDPSHVIYAWGDAVEELSRFAHYGLFELSALQCMSIVNVQDDFKRWYNGIFVHQCHLSPLADDHPTCTCPCRPVKSKNQPWSLQKAVAYTFGQFLDKTRTRSKWSRSLFQAEESQRWVVAELIRYAANDCLAATKLQMALERCFTKEHVKTFSRHKSQPS